METKENHLFFFLPEILLSLQYRLEEVKNNFKCRNREKKKKALSQKGTFAGVRMSNGLLCIVFFDEIFPLDFLPFQGN